MSAIEKDGEQKLGDKIKQFATTVFDQFKRKEGVLPKSVQEMMGTMEKSGEDKITTMQIIRKPVEEYVKVLLQGISKGTYKEAVAESPYDKMFHLSVRLNGKYRLEKNEVISLSVAADKLEDGAEFVRVALPRNDNGDSPITIRSLLEKTKEYMGPLAFTDYNARSNNCQDFVMAILKANGLCTELLENFTHQDAETIFEGMPEVVTAIAETMTDAAAVADKLVEQSRDECRSFISAIAERAKSAKHNKRHLLFFQKAQELHDQYGEDDDIPEEKLRETMAQLRLAVPEGTDIVAKSDVSAQTKADEVFGLMENDK